MLRWTSGDVQGFAQATKSCGKRVMHAAFDLVYPPICVCCRASLEETLAIALCPACRGELAPVGGVHCRRCGAIAGPLDQHFGDCSRCRTERFGFDGVFAMGRYAGSLRDAVLRMKSRHEEPLMMAVGGLLADHFGEQVRGINPDVVLPIPMHWTRRLVRGTNSPELMGRTLARRLNLFFAARAIRRVRRTRQLGTLTRQERKQTMREAFAVANGCGFGGARVLLIDDVLTTGTTCDTAARVLKKGGAAAVFVLVPARAYPGD